MEEAKLNKEWIKKLSTGREDVILHTLKELRKSGTNDLLPAIIDLLQTSRNHEIQSEVISFLNDLKNQSSVDIFIDNLNSHRGRHYFAKLVGACWQNGLDYSDHLEFFIDIVINEDYVSAMEAFTVIESNITRLEAAKREKLAEKIERSQDKVTREKEPLVEELIGIMKPFSGPFSLDGDP
jgi:hypothetical protein